MPEPAPTEREITGQPPPRAAAREAQDDEVVGAVVRGCLRDGAGNGVQGARLQLLPSGLEGSGDEAGDTLTAVSDGDGRYMFEHVALGEYTLSVRAAGYGRTAVAGLHVTNEGLEQDLRLESARMIAGRVVAAGGGPVSGATVQVSSMDVHPQRTRARTETGERGEFAIDDVPAGTYELTVEAKGFERGDDRITTGDMAALVELIPLPRIEGAVVDGATGTPLTRFSVRLREQPLGGSTTVPATELSQQADSLGRFGLFAPKPGTFVVEVLSDSHAGSFSEPFTVEESPVGGIVVSLTRGGSIRGRLLDASGRPVRRALVTTLGDGTEDDRIPSAVLGTESPTATVRDSRSDEQGRFLLEGLTPTTYRLLVRHGEFEKTSIGGVVVLENQESRVGDITLLRGGNIRGVVYDASGAPTPGCIVTLSSRSLPASNYTTKSAADGTYVLVHVQAGAYAIRARRKGPVGSPFLHWEDIKASERQITVSEGEITMDLRLP